MDQTTSEIPLTPSKNRKNAARIICMLLGVLVVGTIIYFFGPTWFLDVLSKRQANLTSIDYAWGGGKTEIIVWENHVASWTRSHGLQRSLFILSSSDMKKLDDQAVAYVNKTKECKPATSIPSSNYDNSNENSATPFTNNTIKPQPTIFSIEIADVCIDCASLNYQYSSPRATFTYNDTSRASCPVGTRSEVEKLASIVLHEHSFGP